MKLPRKQRNPPPQTIIVLSLLVSLRAISVSATVSKKLDQEGEPQIPDTSIKCGTCPCENPCGQLPPPPPCANPCGQLPPPPPPPPPPATPPPPETTCCTPQTPPPPRLICVTCEPGELYHPYADDWGFYSTAERNAAQKWLLLAGCCLLGLLIIW
ncbi:putative Nutrient reservoir [Melia azedarach]|uniref:Nutrient reservoir n=1 Tax=Melia azedarach TaxID=155640 RepID=A0ACC1X6L0_MELAZ|nr:putative Nutrient reservoir [Melia azedarach]